MKTLYKISVLVVLLTILNSCEKVIELDLKDAKQQIVVDANINNGEGNNLVILTKSGSFYESNDFETVKNASVIITKSTGESYVLEEVEDGVYNNDTLNGQFLSNYELNILAEGKTITSSSIMPKLVIIDSISVEVIDDDFGGGGGPGSGPGEVSQKSYMLFVNFTDDINEKNYYRIKVTVNNEYIPDIFVLDDGLFNGLSTKLPLHMGGFFPGDIVTVELLSIDKANYEYYRLLAENDMGAMSTSVGNPVSNVDGEDVIGVFGAVAVDSETIILE